MRTITTMVFILGLGINAWAQQERIPSRVEASGVLGASAFGSDYVEHRLVGGAVDVRLVKGLRVGPEILYHIGRGTDRDMTLSLMTSYDFARSGRITPFVTAAGGILKNFHNGRTWWAPGFMFTAGGGVKIALTRHLFVAPEVRVGNWNPAAQASIRVGYRF